ncbi:MAG TPA: uracil-DNA glycosylase [Bacteroidia bacterium]|nr:uracil-DNA glycosylase [Bacteroidia bacterium]
MTTIEPITTQNWTSILHEQFRSPYFSELKQFLAEEKNSGKTIYPPVKNIFSAFDLTPFENVKVVLLGQDPYHGAGQAHGLCFSVPDGVRPPPSLGNIFKEMKTDLGIPIPQSGNLQKWAKQGVLLINATLTVRANTPGSHQNKGWETFTDAVIRRLSEEKSGLVFILWGKYAQAKEALIDKTKHHVLKAAHPSPFSADSGFFGCRHFSKTNELLKQQGKEPIDWSL